MSEAVSLAIGAIIGYMIGRWTGGRSKPPHLNIDTKERKQMWIREGKI